MNPSPNPKTEPRVAGRASDIGRIFRATRHSLRGLRATWRHEVAFRQEVIAVVPLFMLSFWLARDTVQWLLLVAPLFLLLVVELLNSAVESAIDRISAERHELSGRAKDQASAAVMLSLLLIGLSWGAVAWANLSGTAP